MKIKQLLILSILCFSTWIQIVAQDETNKLDFRLGTGVSLLGSGDMITFNYENELNLKLNQFFTSSLSINLGKSNQGVSELATFIQGNVNIFISPFKNFKRNDFRVGTGLTFYNISDAYVSFLQYENDVLVDRDYVLDHRQSLGWNLIIENTYLLSEKFLVGLKLFTQPYNNGDINTGVMLKIGIRL